VTDLLSRCRRTIVVAMLSLGTSFAAHATYSNLYIFGDSLSDTGNVYTASSGTLPSDPPYYQGRLTNGPVWVETLASGLGLGGASTAWLQGGNNYSWAGAFTGQDGIAGAGTGLLGQVFGQWAPAHAAADPNALYVIGIGGNDLRFLDATYQYGSTPYSDPLTMLGNLAYSLNFLISQGARNFLIANVPDVGLAPESAGHRQESTDLAKTYNALLAGYLNTLALSQQVAIAQLNLFKLIDDVVADANSGGTLYGMHNGTDSCWTGAVSCDDAVFFDYLHPTAQVHALGGAAALALLPEPQGVLLLLTGLAFAAMFTRRSKLAPRHAITA